MKEAAGEANMTVITIVLIAIVLAIGTLIVNRLMLSTEARSCCASIGGEARSTKCYFKDNSGSKTEKVMNQSFIDLYCPENK